MSLFWRISYARDFFKNCGKTALHFHVTSLKFFFYFTQTFSKILTTFSTITAQIFLEFPKICHSRCYFFRLLKFFLLEPPPPSEIPGYATGQPTRNCTCNCTRRYFTHITLVDTFEICIVFPVIGCTSDDQCAPNEACIEGKCGNPCRCGLNAVCDVLYHQATCKCLHGYTGNPLEGCRGS